MIRDTARALVYLAIVLYSLALVQQLDEMQDPIPLWSQQ